MHLYLGNAPCLSGLPYMKTLQIHRHLLNSCRSLQLHIGFSIYSTALHLPAVIEWWNCIILSSCHDTPNMKSIAQNTMSTPMPYLKSKCTKEIRGESHCGLAIYIKNCLKTKEKLWKLKYFTMQKSKRNQNPSRQYSSITNLKFEHKPKYHLSKILI
jgi:hypothetical protein